MASAGDGGCLAIWTRPTRRDRPALGIASSGRLEGRGTRRARKLRMAEQRLYELTIDNLSGDVDVVHFSGSEAIGQLYRFDIVVSSEDAELDLASAVGSGATLTLSNGTSQRHIHGMVLAFELETAETTRCHYRATIVPELWKAHKRQQIRIFQAQSANDIIASVLSGSGLSLSSFSLKLEGSYAPREYCVQYRESDWAFISRLMQEEGMFCYFTHAEGSHELVVTDNVGGAASVGDAVVFRPVTGLEADAESIATFRYRHALRPDLVSLGDYNFVKPSLDLGAAAGGGSLEVYDYPGNYDDPDLGATRARIRAEECQVAAALGTGTSNCMRLGAGHAFAMSEHPRDLDRGYLLVSVTHRGVHHSRDDGRPVYNNEFVCTPDDVPYRLPRVTPKPSIHGVQTAIVTGPAGEEIYTDEHGRVKVQFHWDRLGKRDENSSCWIRVSQMWAGAGWGAMHLPRVGHEVVVSFVEGDPDRPIITGRVYHGTNVPPYVLPAEKTKSTFKSESTTGGGGANELMFEDAKGNEEVYLHAQKDLTLHAENDCKETFGHNHVLDVGNTRDKTVASDESETIGGSKTIQVAGTHTETIAFAETITVGLASVHTVGGAFIESIGAAKTSTVGGASTETVGGGKEVSIGADRSVNVTGDSTLGVGGARKISVTKDYQLTIDKDSTTTVKGNADEQVGKYKSSDVGEAYVLTVGKGKISVKKDGTILVEGKDVTIKGSGAIKIDAAKKIDLTTSATINVKGKGAIKVKGSAVDVN
jgi:type VI secretion system secreted protein VgrG